METPPGEGLPTGKPVGDANDSVSDGRSFGPWWPGMGKTIALRTLPVGDSYLGRAAHKLTPVAKPAQACAAAQRLAGGQI